MTPPDAYIVGAMSTAINQISNDEVDNERGKERGSRDNITRNCDSVLFSFLFSIEFYMMKNIHSPIS